MSAPVDWDALRETADEVRSRSYSPYSGFAVGAALQAEDGRVFTGTNVENASFGLAACAERNAIGAAIAAGAKRFRAIAIVAPGPEPASPCGMCRQVLVEFPPSFPVRCYTPEGRSLESSVAELLPHAFVPENLKP